MLKEIVTIADISVDSVVSLSVVLMHCNSMIIKVIGVRDGVEGMYLSTSTVGTMSSPGGEGINVWVVSLIAMGCFLSIQS